MVSFSTVSVTCGQPWSKNIKWTISEINNKFSIAHCSEKGDEISCHLIPPAQETNHPFVHCVHTVYANRPSVLLMIVAISSEDHHIISDSNLTLRHSAYVIYLTSSHHIGTIISHHHKIFRERSHSYKFHYSMLL